LSTVNYHKNQVGAIGKKWYYQIKIPLIQGDCQSDSLDSTQLMKLFLSNNSRCLHELPVPLGWYYNVTNYMALTLNADPVK
jgi:hypothetical protein